MLGTSKSHGMLSQSATMWPTVHRLWDLQSQAEEETCH